MPATKTPFQCGHRGYGGKCHRCELADKLEEAAKAGRAAVKAGGSVHPFKTLNVSMGQREQAKMATYDQRPVLKGEEAKAALMAEASRLRGR